MESEETKSIFSNAAVMVLTICFVIFVAAQVLIVAGVFNANDADGLFANVLYGADKILENPVIIAFIAGLLVNFFGFLENYVKTGETYDAHRLLETWMLYEPLLILLSQAMTPQLAMVFTLAIDMTRRILTRLV